MLTGACLCGAFATNLIVDAGKFRITAGSERLAAYESSPQKFRHFCSSCGSPIYSRGEKTRQVVSVRAGTLKQEPGVRVAYHAFTGSKAPWVRIADEAPQFHDWPDPELIRRL